MSCTICMEEFDSTIHVPKLLPCQHTFCNSCLTNMGKAFIEELHIACPVCRSKHRVPRRGFTTNRAVLNIVEEFHKEKARKKNEPVLKCAEHENMPSVLVCTDCLTGLCLQCTKRLPKSRHRKHCVEDLHQAQIVLQKLAEKQLKSEQSKLDKDMASSISSENPLQELEEAEHTIEMMHEILTAELNAWKGEQLSTIGEFKNAIIDGKNYIQAEKEKLESLSNQNELNSLITFLTQKDIRWQRLQETSVSPDKYDFVTSREALVEKIQRNLFPLYGFGSKILNQPSKRLLSDIKYACKLFAIYSVLILIVAAFFAYDIELWLHMTIKNTALVFALAVILCVTHVVVDTVFSYYNSLYSPYDMIIKDIEYGLELLTLTYIFFVFAWSFLVCCFYAYIICSQDEHCPRHMVQDLKHCLQDPDLTTYISYFLLLMFGLVAKGCILRFTMYKIVTSPICGRYGPYARSTEPEKKRISEATFCAMFAAWALWVIAGGPLDVYEKYREIHFIFYTFSFCIMGIIQHLNHEYVR